MTDTRTWRGAPLPGGYRTFMPFVSPFHSVLPILKLSQASARKLKPQAQPPPTLHERILEEIKAERKLRPVSPDEIRRGRLGKETCHAFMIDDVVQIHSLYTPYFTFFTLKCLTCSQSMHGSLIALSYFSSFCAVHD